MHLLQRAAGTYEKGLEKALEAGCVGISYGLRYVPGTGRDEFLDTASCCEKEHRMISAHVRDDEDRVFGAVAEVAEAGKLYNIPVQVSHIGSMVEFRTDETAAAPGRWLPHERY